MNCHEVHMIGVLIDLYEPHSTTQTFGTPVTLMAGMHGQGKD